MRAASPPAHPLFPTFLRWMTEYKFAALDLDAGTRTKARAVLIELQVDCRARVRCLLD